MQLNSTQPAKLKFAVRIYVYKAREDLSRLGLWSLQNLAHTKYANEYPEKNNNSIIPNLHVADLNMIELIYPCMCYFFGEQH